MKTPLGRVLGLGSARSGTHHFWRMRLTAIALLPLSVFLVALLVALTGDSHASVAEVLGRPIVVVPLILAILLTAVHMRLGLQEVIEDYVHAPGPKLLATLGNLAFVTVVTAASVFALLKLSLGA